MIRVREHGETGPTVIVLHGGPAAVGEAAPIARRLGSEFRALEPWQRGSGAVRLTVAGHVSDLEELIRIRCGGSRPALVGESWGAMLALAFAAAHPKVPVAIALVGCGTFDLPSRERLREILEDRMDERVRRAVAAIERETRDPGIRMRRKYSLLEPLYNRDPLPVEPDPEVPDDLDLRAHTETWEDMLRLQREGVYPASFRAIRSPVLMIHGKYDPHPGRMIRDSLLPHIPHLEYRELSDCGHCPWRERTARETFFEGLIDWLHRHSSG